jgi:hypothetical protein
MHFIVVSESSGPYCTGEVVFGANREKFGSDVDLLPVDEDLALQSGPVDGYFRRDWGRGVAFASGRGERRCPMVLRAYDRRAYIHWAARLIPLGPDPSGQIRLSGDGSGGFESGIAPVVVPGRLESLILDGKGGVTIHGTCELASSPGALVGLALYGAAREVAVVWSAVSLCSRSW